MRGLAAQPRAHTGQLLDFIFLSLAAHKISPGFYLQFDFKGKKPGPEKQTDLSKVTS